MSLFVCSSHQCLFNSISLQLKKEEAAGDRCKVEPMDSVRGPGLEDRKPDVKVEPKEEEEGSGSAGPLSSPPSAQSKRKSKAATPARPALPCDAVPALSL